MFSWFGEALGLAKGGLDIKSSLKQSKATGKAERFEADLILDNAKTRLAAGTRQANLQRHQSRVVQSDAKAQMAASGGGVDIQDMAKIKSRADFNAISTLFTAQEQASNMRTRAANMKYRSRQNEYQRARSAYTGAFGNIINTGVRAFTGGAISMPSVGSIGSSSSWQPVGTY